MERIGGTNARKCKSKSIGEKVKRMGTEQKNQWHQRRGAHPINYTDLGELKTLLSSNESKFFPHILSKKEWFLNLWMNLSHQEMFFVT